jgi:hypothetical protein
VSTVVATNSHTFRVWLRNEIAAILDRKTIPPPLVIYCDPDCEWRELLLALADGDTFELQADDKHDLNLAGGASNRTAPPPRGMGSAPMNAAGAAPKNFRTPAGGNEDRLFMRQRAYFAQCSLR